MNIFRFLLVKIDHPNCPIYFLHFQQEEHFSTWTFLF